MNLAYKVTGDQENIIISLSRESVDQKALEKLLDYLELESIRRRSQLTEPDAESLTSDVKQAVYTPKGI